MNLSPPMPLRYRALSIGEQFLPFFIVAIHFSTSATLAFWILIATLWLASFSMKSARNVLEQSPSALYALILFAVLAFSVVYSTAPLPKAFGALFKYRVLLLPLILIPFLSSEQTRNRSEKFLLAALITTMLISCAAYAGLISTELAYVPLKNRITHSLFMAFLGFFCLHRLYERDRHRLFWILVLILAGFNLFIVGDGRTGQLAFLLLSALFFLQVFSARTAIILAAVTLAAFTAFMFLSPHAARFFDGINESALFFRHDNSVTETSMGLRLGWWRDTLDIIAQSPWIGQGIGGLAFRYQQVFPHQPVVVNPHNEYLLMTAQLGLPGLLLFLAFLASILRQATRLPQSKRWLLQGLWLLLAISCLFNSSLLDHTEGHWFLTLVALYSASDAMLYATKMNSGDAPAS
ncbi:MAG: O-antigen ligase family protein [Methylomonas sp.]|nr:O-antigen ligase family protein [Methylomonas sp.]